jgi:hypothetical protein
LLWNNTFLCKMYKKFWPELEVNFTHYYGGTTTLFRPVTRTLRSETCASVTNSHSPNA